MQAKTDRDDIAQREIQIAYKYFNKALFGGVLPECQIIFHHEVDFKLGFMAGTPDGAVADRIVLHFGFFVWVPPAKALQSLVHEMIHLWQFHFGVPARNKSHNREFAAKSRSIGLMTSTTGGSGGTRTGPVVIDYPIAGGPFALAVPRAAVAWESVILKNHFR